VSGVRAAAIVSLPAETFEQVELPEPVAGLDEVVLEVEACGICGTDLHILAGSSYAPELPFVLGHEPVGRVIEAGDDARTWLGNRVAITLFTGCGTCALCQARDERLCENLVAITGVLARAGGFAQRMVVRAAQVVSVPGELDPADAASLVDAGATAANAVRRAPSDAALCVILGGGPVGFLAAEMLRAEGRECIVVEPQDGRRQALRSLGHAVEPATEGVPRPDVVLDCAGAPEATTWALGALRPRGTLVVVGYGVLPAFDSAPIARKELSIAGVRSGDRRDLEQSLLLAASGRIRLPAISRFPLSSIDEAFQALRAGAIPGKAVIIP
jgi:2-desacetyl-2-hydroxyethyl bacteriochlorophyllide A dehydrogenase